MGALVIDSRTLPPSVSSYFDVARVKVEKKDGQVVLSPAKVEKGKKKFDINKLYGAFSDGKISTEDFLRQRAIEGMEN
jgi:hypothetical protein